jgi:predicted RNA binding protein YcfA (HicA-like mRNA interferase family)
MAKNPKDELMNCKKTRDFVDIITDDYGYSYDHKTGSHAIYTSSDHATLSVPDEREIARGTLRNLVKLILEDDYYSG